MVFRRLIRSLPTRRGVIGVATCDKGLPAMMMALAGMHDLPCVLVPGRRHAAGRTRRRRRQAFRRSARALRTGRSRLEEAAEAGCRACAVARRRLPVPRHRGHVASSGRGARHVAAALRARAFGPADLARHGAPVRPRAVPAWTSAGLTMRDILTRRSRCTMPWCVHAAFGGSTNLTLHLPAIAHRTPA